MTVFSQQRGDLNVEGQDITVEFVATESATAPRNGAGFHPCQGLVFQPKEPSCTHRIYCRPLQCRLQRTLSGPTYGRAGFRIPGLEYPVSW